MLAKVLKYNPNHDKDGKFAKTGAGGGGASPKAKEQSAPAKSIPSSGKVSVEGWKKKSNGDWQHADGHTLTKDRSKGDVAKQGWKLTHANGSSVDQGPRISFEQAGKAAEGLHKADPKPMQGDYDDKKFTTLFKAPPAKTPAAPDSPEVKAKAKELADQAKAIAADPNSSKNKAIAAAKDKINAIGKKPQAALDNAPKGPTKLSSPPAHFAPTLKHNDPDLGRNWKSVGDSNGRQYTTQDGKLSVINGKWTLEHASGLKSELSGKPTFLTAQSELRALALKAQKQAAAKAKPKITSQTGAKGPMGISTTPFPSKYLADPKP